MDGTIRKCGNAMDGGLSEEASDCPEVNVNDSIRALEVKESTNVLGLKVAPLSRTLDRRLQVETVK
jgi:hypothetical protein